MKDKLVLIDGNALVHRAFHALPPLRTKKGELVNAVYGFASILFRVLKELTPDYLAVAFDLAGPTFRDIEYKEYKAKRVKPPQELYDQIPLIKELIKALALPIYEKEGFEADDLIGTIVSKVPAKDRKTKVKTIIVTGDLDTLQLIDENTEVYTPQKGIKDAVIYDQSAVKKRYGIRPKQIADLKGLKGDPSDNILGVPGIGEIFYLQEVTVDSTVGDVSTDAETGDITIDKATAERLMSTGEWQLATDKCKHIKLNKERCETTRKEGERFCELHMRIYSPGDTPTEAANGSK